MERAVLGHAGDPAPAGSPFTAPHAGDVPVSVPILAEMVVQDDTDLPTTVVATVDETPARRTIEDSGFVDVDDEESTDG